MDESGGSMTKTILIPNMEDFTGIKEGIKMNKCSNYSAPAEVGDITYLRKKRKRKKKKGDGSI